MVPWGRRRGPAAPQPREREPWAESYRPDASEDDILACFRLLLGRMPNREEWPGHRTHAGHDLASVVGIYLNSLEFTQRGLLRSNQGAGIEVVGLPGTDGRVRVHVDPADLAVGRHVRSGSYEPEVTSVFRHILRPGMGVVDIGANIGHFALLSASIVGPDGYVLAVEPNPRNARLLEASRRANNFAWMELAQVAAGPGTGMLALHTAHSNGTTSDPGDDTASLLAAETVACLRVDALLPPRRIDLVKVDVEGAEYKALLGCQTMIRRDRPFIVSEFSPDLMPGISGIEGRHYLAWLVAAGYDIAVIQPDGGLLQAGHDAETVMQAYRDRGSDHVDLLAFPTGHPPQ